MPLTISKTAASSNTTYTIGNFQHLRINGITPVDIISDNLGNEDDTMLVKISSPALPWRAQDILQTLMSQ